MPTIDNAGNASAALYTPPVKVQEPTQAVTTRPVVETSPAEASSTSAVSESNLGKIIDTTA